MRDKEIVSWLQIKEEMSKPRLKMDKKIVTDRISMAEQTMLLVLILKINS
jgi:hypothetical protein